MIMEKWKIKWREFLELVHLLSIFSSVLLCRATEGARQWGLGTSAEMEASPWECYMLEFPSTFLCSYFKEWGPGANCSLVAVFARGEISRGVGGRCLKHLSHVFSFSQNLIVHTAIYEFLNQVIFYRNLSNFTTYGNVTNIWRRINTGRGYEVVKFERVRAWRLIEKHACSLIWSKNDLLQV